ncbi:MAG: ROK family protein [Christensenellales bacterium]|jgi:glucokinase
MNIGIDIGGTKTSVGLVDKNGEIILERTFPTRAQQPEVLVDEVVDQTKHLCQDAGIPLAQVHSIGIGVPGTVDFSTGHVVYCPNIHWYDVQAGEMFSSAFGRQVLVSQDSRNAALAELLFGAGREYTDFMCITIGTGIGCGIVTGGRVYHGGMNTAGELGHISVEKDGIACPCGNKGCLERYASGNAIFEHAFALNPEAFNGLPHRCETVFALARKGNQEMLGVIEKSVDYLAFGLANAVAILSPQAILISGGLSVHHDLLIKPLTDRIYHYGYYSWTVRKMLRVLPAALGKHAPMIGAAFL